MPCSDIVSIVIVRQILGTLLQAGPHYLPEALQRSVLMEASRCKQLCVVQAMYGWRPSSALVGRWILGFSVAVASHRIEVLEYLLFTVKCDPNGNVLMTTVPGIASLTSLHVACMNAQIEALGLLIWAGADLDARDSVGLSAMAYALQGTCQEFHLICKYLEHCGAELPRVQPCATAEQQGVLNWIHEDLQVSLPCLRTSGDPLNCEVR